ncbi:uncharacterized protein V6R79_021359 [Siganus canaliculatus]
MEKHKQTPKRVFINNIDSYASKWIAKILSERVTGGPIDDEGGSESEEPDRGTPSDGVGGAFRLVGTVSDKSGEDMPYVQEQYLTLNKEQLLSKVMDCDVVIYNITQHPNQIAEALWVVSALHDEMCNFSGPKIFILVSTVMTWACSNIEDPDLPLTDEMFFRRKAHHNFKKHMDLEKRVAKMGQTNRKLLSTYVIASGVQYGMGEHILHFLFKTSWLGQENSIPVFGNGNNIIPMIHVKDLASVVQNVIEHQPKPYYLLAVDASSSTMRSIVKVFACALSSGKIHEKPPEEAFLIQELSLMDLDSIMVNLRMESVHIKKLLSINWLCDSGLVENIDLVVEEYRQTRGLLPVRVCVLGPPAVGKSTFSKQICEHYKLHHITLKGTVSETICKREDAMKNAALHAVDEHSAAEAQELLNSLNDNGDLLDDKLRIKLLKEKLLSNPCRNQGFVLDGFPETQEQALELFCEQPESEDGTSPISSDRITPEFVLCLDASDAFLKDRVMNLPERLVQAHNYEQEHFIQRLARFRENNLGEKAVVNYFEELDIPPLHLDTTGNSEPDHLLLMQRIYHTIGPRRNYSSNIQEMEEEGRKKSEKRMQEQSQESAEEHKEDRERDAHWEQWTKDLRELRQQEEELLKAQSLTERTYLLEHIMPPLKQGLIECIMSQPQDPVDFLVEYLLKNKPFN